MRKRVVLALAVGLLLAADEPKKDKTDRDKLQGTWQPVSVEQGGKAKEDKEHRLLFDGDTFTIKKGDQVFAKGTFKVDPDKKPKAIDFMITEGDEKGKTARGIYKLEGDKLTWCSAQPGQNDRPKEFATKDTQNLLVVLQRAKS